MGKDEKHWRDRLGSGSPESLGLEVIACPPVDTRIFFTPSDGARPLDRLSYASKVWVNKSKELT